MRSEYMEWSKLRSEARFNLATSGLTSVAFADFPFRLGELEITRAGGYGYEPLQDRIARHTGVPKECIVATAGTSMANHLAMAAVLNPGDDIVVEQPTYGPLLDLADYFGARVTRIPRRVDQGFAIDPSDVEKAMTSRTRLVVLTNLHNPSGALIPRESLQAIGQIAQDRGAYVLVDEVYLEMLFEQNAVSSFAVGQKFASPENNPFIATNSLTKVYGLSGLRCGWISAAPDLARRIWLLNDLFEVNAAHPAERMSVAAFDHLEKFRARARAVVTANRSIIEAFFDSRPDLECFRPPGGTVMFPRLLRGDSEEFVKTLHEKYETSVVPGKFFEMPQHFRIGIGGDTPELRQGLERLSAALDKYHP